ncbi:hypothetical protein GQX73_g1260 [Xylaria multiplex]|uniref:Uncharacterized protein n=1 Tax=Xylaria multiplex TaxID=323545 RepID=A0A7C8IWL2_9PEZI|nr:hypothetical protein GQX73_g1260 [Xylaria multiplex]
MSARHKNYGEIWSDTWLWEILSIILSGVCFALTLVLLKIYDQRAPPQFIYGITLNALISILTTFSKSALLVVVAGAISQLKWRWFQNTNGKSVLDTQLFDDASRGPWGSIVLLATPHTWSLASMGALVSILALALDPFAQQLLSYPTRQIIATDAAAQASNMLQATSFVVGNTSRSRSDITNRVIASLWDLESEAEGFATVRCPTGNCAWDDFESLAMCTPCQNRTSDIGLPDFSLSWDASLGREALESIAEGSEPHRYVHWGKFSLYFPPAFQCDIDPSDFSITGTVSLSLSGSYSYPSSLEYPSHLFGASIPYQVYVDNNGLNVSTQSVPLLRFCYIQLHRGHNEKLSIKESTTCQLIPCVRKYSYTISNGVPTLKATGERYGSWSYNASSRTLFGGQISYSPIILSWVDLDGRNRQLLNLSNEKIPKAFQIENFDIDQFREIGDLFQGSITAVDKFADDKRNFVSNTTGVQFKQEFFRGSDSSLTAGDSQLQRIADSGGLSWFMPTIAARLSKYMREKDGIPVMGRSYATITIVEVRWPWVSLLAVVWLCAVAFLMLTMWICRGSDWVLWKTSSLPWIYHGLEPHSIEAIKATATRVDKVSGMEMFAKTLRATLRKDPTDGQLKLKMTQ